MGDLPSEVKDACLKLRTIAKRIETEFNDQVAGEVFADLDAVHSWMKAHAPAPSSIDADRPAEPRQSEPGVGEGGVVPSASGPTPEPEPPA